MSAAQKTTDHKAIQRWVESRGGRPSRVASTGEEGEGGILLIDFGEKEPSLEEISWEEFFRTFEDRHLAFLYQDEAGKGGKSRFFKFIDRDSDDEDDDAN